MDDCLSAVDAHTSHALVQDCFLGGPMASKTRILITHALHVLDKVDYVYVMDKGKIVEHGTPAVCNLPSSMRLSLRNSLIGLATCEFHPLEAHRGVW
jgi:ABC-type transport system involved in cytochrome bd biosynthesis fused ATPase/permease subunit